MVGANAQPRLNAILNMLPICRICKGEYQSQFRQSYAFYELTQVRPYISDKGARKRGYFQRFMNYVSEEYKPRNARRLQRKGGKWSESVQQLLSFGC